tara:strand:- start:70 stop:741 length:672 start_codon:yes stop_codon:yes gene_type:complete
MNYRYERKFHTSVINKNQVFSTIKSHPLLFNEIHHERKVNNIYFDTERFKNYYDNIDGNNKREKIRIRWYGKTFNTLNNASLEIKSKNGNLGSKQRYQLQPIILNESRNLDNLINFYNENVPAELINKLFYYKPTLINSYNRIYFQDISRRFRITIDDKLFFYNVRTSRNPNSFLKKIDNNLIIEFKYKDIHDSDFSEMIQYFNFRLSKFSKYVTGLKKTINK